MKKVAIIGAGQVAEKVHAAYYQKRSDVLELAAVVDPVSQRAEDFCRRTGFSHAYTSVTQMLNEISPDIVSVCTPNRFHFEHVLAALEANASVMCEKPPAMTADQARKMAETADKNGQILAYGFQHRFSDEATMIKNHLDVLGDIYYVEANALRRSGVPGWGTFIDKELQGGGPLIDYGIHMLDTAMYITGFPKVKSVRAYSFQKIGTKKNSGKFGKWDPSKFTVEDAIFGTLELENGKIIQLNTSFALNIGEDKLNVAFCGDQAGANLYPGELFEDVDGKLVSLQKTTPVNDPHELSMAHFVNRALGDQTQMIADGWQGYVIQNLVENLYRSAETGEVITL
ncbi:TPA: Gfo/Idh/MocA family oxidoreductase [Enterococcus faecium]|nr:Gfo/Idh/MocA family oxidoreductase [Enterococcus faecium]